MAFKTPRRALLEVPILAFLKIPKPVYLYVDEKKEIINGVLTQTLRPWKKPVAYIKPGPSGPRIVNLPPDHHCPASQKCWQNNHEIGTFYYHSHSIEGILKNSPSWWLSNARLLHFPALLWNPPYISYNPSSTLNPATLLPDSSSDVHHDCSIVLYHIQNTRLGLTDILCPEAEHICFMDGSSLIQNGIKCAGATIID